MHVHVHVHALLWLFPTRELGSDLEAVGEQIVEVLHPVVHKVPLSPVTDAGAECVRVTQTFSEEILSSPSPKSQSPKSQSQDQKDLG